MAIKFRSSATKFLEKASLEDIERIQEKLNQILSFVEEQGIIPLSELDIKKMKGELTSLQHLYKSIRTYTATPHIALMVR